MNLKNTKRLFAAALTLTMLSAAGCTQNHTETSEQTERAESSAAAVSSEAEEEESKEASSEASEESLTIPEISDPTPDNEGEMVNGILVYNDVAYELFYGSEGMAKYYAETVSGVKKALGDSFNVYNVVVPTHVAVDLPAKFDDICNSQKDYLNTIVNSYTENVIGVNTYDRILHHRNEYLYFHSDHHWTALGAYYAYEEFCNKAGITPIRLSDLKEDKIEGYVGSMEYFTGLETLKEDTVSYYTVDHDIECTLYDEDGENPQDYNLIHSYASGSNAYGVFLGGDTPILVTKNEKGNGKKIAVLKESYGNAFSPFISYTYSEAHLIDFRYVNIDLKSYLEKNGITDVLIINNAMASATDARCEELAGLVGGVSYSDEDESTVADEEDNDTDNEEDNNEDFYTEDNNDSYEDENEDSYDDEYADTYDEDYDDEEYYDEE